MSYKPYPKYKPSGVEWIGEIPEGWAAVRLKFVSKSVKTGKTPPSSAGRDYALEGSVNWYTPADFAEKNFLRKSSRKLNVAAVDEGHVEVYEGNSLYLIGIGATLGKIAISKERATANQQLNIITFNERVLPEYAMYFYKPFRDVIFNSAQFTTLPILNQTLTKELPIVVPTVDAQTKITTFLDRKTAQIDKLIEIKRRQIELLKEERTAIINQAVTKGLNPDAKMKESGVEWIGEIPEGWECWTVRNLIRSEFIEVQDGNHGELHPTANDYVDEGIPFLMANNIRNNTIDIQGCKQIPKELADSLRIGFAKSGDVLLTHKGTVGETAIIPETLNCDYLMLTPQVTYYRMLSNKVEAQYMNLYFRSYAFIEQLRKISLHQSTRHYVGLTAQRDIYVVVPPENIQKQLVAYLICVVGEIDQTISKAQQQIQLLKEYRTTLISDVVTGKIDIREEVA